MSLVLHDSAVCAPHGAIEFINTPVGHGHLAVLVDVSLLLGVDTVDRGAGRIHFLFDRFVLRAESVGPLEASIVVLIRGMGFETMVSLFAEHGVYHNRLVLGVQVGCSMERIVQVLDGGRHLRPGADGVGMHGLLLRLAKGGKLRGYSLGEALLSLIEVWSLLTRHSEDRLVLFRCPSWRLVCPTAIGGLLCSTSIGGLAREASYLGPLRFLEREHLLVVRRTLHCARVG